MKKTKTISLRQLLQAHEAFMAHEAEKRGKLPSIEYRKLIDFILLMTDHMDKRVK